MLHAAFIAKVGLGRNPAPQRAGAGSRPRQMALKWSKMGYIPFIASQNCLKGNLGRGTTQGSCPLFRSTSSALAQPFDAPTAARAGRGMRPIARTNPRTHTRPRFAARCIDLPWSPPRTGPRGGDAAVVLATYDTPRLSAAAAAVYLGSWLTAINAQLTRFAPRGSVMGVRKSCYATLSPLAETGRRHRVHEKYITGSRVGDSDRVAHWVRPGVEALR